MDQTDFSYQNYVKKMHYKSYNWPPDISLAGLHSRCSEPGKQNPLGVACPCCGYTIKLKMNSWIKRDIYQDFKQTGAGIPAYFALLKFYSLIAIILFLTNAPFYLYATNLACQIDSRNCLYIGFLTFLDFDTILQTLQSHQFNKTVNTLLSLQTLVFYILLIANNISIFYLIFVSRKCKHNKKSTNRFMSLIVQNLPDGISQQEIKKLLVLPNGNYPKIISITPIKMLFHFNQIFKERILAFFELKAMYIQCIDPKRQFLKNQKLRKLNQQFKTMSEGNIPKVKAIIMFEDHHELMEIYKKHHYKQIYHWAKRIYNWFLQQNKSSEIFVNFLPELSEVMWINIGEDHKVKLISKIISFIVTGLLLGACYVLFYFPLMLVLGIDSTQKQSNITLFQKFFPTFIALALVGISILFRLLMQKLGRDRRPRTTNQQSHFVLITTIMFHLIFYLIIPTLFFKINNGLPQSIKLFAISSQARTFLFVQLIMSFLDIIFRMWRMNKQKTLADQRQAFKYPQKLLHQKVQYRQYPVQIKLIVIFKIWSLVLFYSFYVPVVMFYIVIATILLYILQKRNIYQHYAVRKYLSSKLQIRFLNIYINFFCLYQCLIYLLNVSSNWQRILAVTSTFISLLLQFIYWQILKKRENIKQKHKIQRAKSLMLRSLSVPDSSFRQTLKQQFILNKNNQSQYGQDQEDISYGCAYEKFLEDYNQPQLNQQIQKYLKVSEVRHDEEQQKCIQMEEQEKFDM